MIPSILLQGQIYDPYNREILITDERGQGFLYTFKVRRDTQQYVAYPHLLCGTRTGHIEQTNMRGLPSFLGARSEAWKSPELWLLLVFWFPRFGFLSLSMPAKENVPPPHLNCCFACPTERNAKVLYVIGHPGATEGGDLMNDVLYVNVRTCMSR